MIWLAATAVAAVIAFVYLVGFALCRSAARNDRLDRAYFRDRAETEAKYQCSMTKSEADELTHGRWD